MDQSNCETIKIVAVLVLYNECLETSATWNTLFSSSPLNVHWLIYNNGPSPVEIPEECGIAYQESLDNSGLVPAYRAGLEMAKNINATHLLLLDQDTLFPRNFWDLQMACLETFPGESLYVPTVFGERVMLSPNTFDRRRGIAQATSYEKLPNPLSLASFSIVNSGALFTLAAFELACTETVALLFLDNIDNAMTAMLWQNGISARWFHAEVHQKFSGEKLNPQTDYQRFKIWQKDARQFGEITGCRFWQEFWILKRKFHYTLLSKNLSYFR